MPPNQFAPSNYQPQISSNLSSTPPPRKSVWPKIITSVLVLILVALAVFVYVYRYEVFESSWRHSMNKIEMEYASEALITESQFNDDKMEPLQSDAATSTFYQYFNDERISKINDTVPLLEKLKVKIDEGIKHTSNNSSSLSAEDATARDLYASCYEGRGKAIDAGLEALNNTLKLNQAHKIINEYINKDFKNFKISGTALGNNLMNRNMSAIPASIADARRDTALAKATMDKMYDLLGYESDKEASGAFQLMLDGLDDIENALKNMDAELMTSGGNKFAKATDIFNNNNGKSTKNIGDWIDKKIIVKFKEQNEGVMKVNDICIQAGASSKLNKENTPINKLMSNLKGV